MKPTVTIIGGGIVGLSLAYELLHRNWQVTIVERHRFGNAASWAAAGILLPANRLTANHPLEHLSALSNRLHVEWAKKLESETGVNNGHHRCGGLYVARTAGEVASLTGLQFQWTDEQISFEALAPSDVKSLPYVANNQGALSDVRQAIALQDESQICNPHHTQALVQACQARGARLLECTKVETVLHSGATDEVTGVQLASGDTLTSDQYVFAAGPWTGQTIDFESLPMLPVRGQIVMFKLPKQIFAPIVYEGSHYLVPRKDGHVLAGATLEEVGFDCTTTQTSIEMLMQFAKRQFPQLNEQTKVKHWAGLRPTTFDGFPYLGRLRQAKNAYVSTGHFRLGIQLSTGSAQVVADLMEGVQPEIDISTFSPHRIVG